MPNTAESPQLNILHVLTLNGRNGEYGGPVRVARELCTELNSRGHATHIFSGARKGSEPTPKPGLAESFVLVKPISRRLAVSSLWSWKLIGPLNKLIKSADTVHIHFARDLISFLSALLSILDRKPFVAQTHGMVIPDERRFTKLVDFFLAKPILNRAQANLVLNKFEQKNILALGVKSEIVILPNGISISNLVEKRKSASKTVIFCSRLDKRKGIEKFIRLAEISRTTGFKFEIYGPDGGELNLVFNQIEEKNLEKVVQYMGSLPFDQVKHVLLKSDLLILPSKDEPFPMIVLESLAIGTPVLIDQTCGIRIPISFIDKKFVVNSNNIVEMQAKMLEILSKYGDWEAQKKLIQNTDKFFSIRKVCDEYLRIIGTYLK
jgi:glycosyltransferase involved in cell wall biosynthesis